MAFNSIIGALRVVLGVDTAAFDTAMKETSSKLADFGKDITKAAGVVGAAFAAVGAAVAAAVKHSIDQSDQLGKLSEKLGVPVEQLSALKYAAETTGTGLDKFGDTLKSFGEKLREAEKDGESGPAKTFAAMGIAIKDAEGKLRNVGDVFIDVAKQWNDFAPTAKADLGERFGLTELIPLLNKGADGITALTDEARKFGMVIDGPTAAAASAFNENLSRLKQTKDQLWQVVTARLAPALQVLSEQFLEYTRDATQSQEATGLLTASFKVLASALQGIIAGFATLREIGKGIWDTLDPKMTTEDIVNRHAKTWENIKRIWGDGVGAVKSIWNDWSATVAKAGPDVGTKLAPVIDAAKEAETELGKARAELNAFVQAPTQNFAEKMLAIQQAVTDNIIPAGKEIALTTQVIGQMREENRKLLDDMMNNTAESYGAKILAIRDALDEGTISMREFRKRNQEAFKDLIGNWTSLGTTAANALTTMFSDNKAASIAAAFINTAVGVTKALSIGGPFGWAQAALIAAAGAAQIAKIKSTSIGGGGGGAPSVSQASDGGGAQEGPYQPAGLNQTMTVSGINPGDIFSGETMRRLAEQLLDYQRRGGTVIFEENRR